MTQLVRPQNISYRESLLSVTFVPTQPNPCQINLDQRNTYRDVIGIGVRTIGGKAPANGLRTGDFVYLQSQTLRANGNLKPLLVLTTPVAGSAIPSAVIGYTVAGWNGDATALEPTMQSPTFLFDQPVTLNQFDLGLVDGTTGNDLSTADANFSVTVQLVIMQLPEVRGH